MSKVTNLIIATSLIEDIEYLKGKFKQHTTPGYSIDIVSVDDEKLPKGWYGGNKFLEVNLFIGAYNYFNLENFLMFCKQEINWEMPESVQIFVKEQDDLRFRIINLF
jgi:hypothetical protein